MDEIRLIRKEELSEIKNWWKDGMNTEFVYPLTSTFVYKKENKLLYAVAAHCVESIPTAYIDGFIKNPQEKSDHHAVGRLQEYMEGFIKAKGFRLLIVTTKDEKVSLRHKDLGYNIVDKPLYSGWKLI